METNCVISNAVPVRDADAVAAVMDRYYTEFDWTINDDGLFSLGGTYYVPWAVPLSDLPAAPDEDDPEWERWSAEVEDILYARGDRGFLDLLTDLGPYLAAPLTVVALHAAADGLPEDVSAFRVEPGRPA